MATILQQHQDAGTADVISLHRHACQSTRKFVSGILPGQWQNACNSEGDVRGLVNHLVNGQLWAVELLHGKNGAEPIAELEGDLLGDDPLAAYDAACAAAQAAWEEPGAVTRTCTTSHGEVPAAMFGSMRVLDVFVHGWDLAVATGQDDTLDEGLAAAVYAEWLPREGMIRHSGMFAEPPQVVPDAGVQTKLLALLGRARATLRAHELGHVGMYVRNLDASVRFYRDLIGFAESGRVPGAVFLTTGRSHHELALIEPGPEAVPGPRQPAFGLNHLAVKVGNSLDELRGAYQRVTQAGLPVHDIWDFTMQQSIQVDDPDGTVVELYVDAPVDWRDPSIIAQALPKPLQL
ncbi:MAG TPA: TIGR03086 family metal-binding protein [Chloroflexota bacterium]|nr:TIGR03086 family metal-binding protein [Chloroflexota bacterium]